ncbi:hypothetical protein N9466_07160 [Amylibacter sp.]|nr:hypothetical protein [Amylibacter sp.]
MIFNTISKFKKILFILALFNPITAASYADEIICSNLATAYLESRYQKENFRLFFPPLLKITNEYIYLSDNKKTDANIEWYAKIKNQNGSLKNSMAIRSIIDMRNGKEYDAIVRYNYQKNNSIYTSTQLSGLDNYGLPPNIYKGCVLNKSLRNGITNTQTQQPQSSKNNTTYNSQKDFCSEIGFEPGTESFGNCVLKMMDKN